MSFLNYSQIDIAEFWTILLKRRRLGFALPELDRSLPSLSS